MQKESSWKNRIKKWINNDKVIDVIIFGSYVRNKENPKDIDLCILIKKEQEKKVLDLIDSLRNILDERFHINTIMEGDIISGNTLTKTLFNEGVSIKTNKKFAESIGFKPKSLFKYSLKNFSPSKRVRFHYLLKGRNSEGILKEINGNLLSNGILIVDTEKEDITKRILERWGVKFEIRRGLF